MCVIESSSFVAAGFGTLFSQVAGFHRAVPSTALDKACMQFQYILPFFLEKSTLFCFLTKNIHNSVIDNSSKNWYDVANLFRR